jgi:hypothetical protein
MRIFLGNKMRFQIPVPVNLSTLTANEIAIEKVSLNKLLGAQKQLQSTGKIASFAISPFSIRKPVKVSLSPFPVVFFKFRLNTPAQLVVIMSRNIPTFAHHF